MQCFSLYFLIFWRLPGVLELGKAMPTSAKALAISVSGHRTACSATSYSHAEPVIYLADASKLAR